MPLKAGVTIDALDGGPGTSYFYYCALLKPCGGVLRAQIAFAGKTPTGRSFRDSCPKICSSRRYPDGSRRFLSRLCLPLTFITCSTSPAVMITRAGLQRYLISCSSQAIGPRAPGPNHPASGLGGGVRFSRSISGAGFLTPYKVYSLGGEVLTYLTESIDERHKRPTNGRTVSPL